MKFPFRALAVATAVFGAVTAVNGAPEKFAFMYALLAFGLLWPFDQKHSS
jgi:hypothetical protein